MSLGGNIVLLDMDGVLFNFEDPNNAIIRTHFPDVPIVENRSSIYYKDTYSAYPKVCEKIYQENRRPGFFSSFPLVDFAVEGFARILEAGYTPIVCSSPLEDHKTVIDEKKASLEEHLVPIFGTWVIDTAIFDRDKSKYDAIAMIDDHPSIRGAKEAIWQQIVFSRSYNHTLGTDFRLILILKDYFLRQKIDIGQSSKTKLHISKTINTAIFHI
jgi:5'-nucleotidase